MKRHSSQNTEARNVKNPIHDKDFISRLPNGVLETILIRLTLEEAMRTSVLSTRWVDLWKYRPSLVLDMEERMTTTPLELKPEISVHLAKAMSKVITNHRGNLENCILHHRPSQSEDGTLQSWVDTVTLVKHTEDLMIVNHGKYHECRLLPDKFSQESLTTLSLTNYFLVNAHAFKNCSNLHTLKLLQMFVSHISVLSSLFKACSSLEVLVMHACPLDLDKSGVLKISNRKLKFLQIFSPFRIGRIEVNAVSLEVLDILDIKCKKDQFFLDAPNIRSNRNLIWIAGKIPNASYNISNIAQEKRRVWHEILVNDCDYIRDWGCLSVSVDLTNPTEVEILKEFFLMWKAETQELEIFFKKNQNPRREGEYSNLWEDAKPFPCANLRVDTLWMYNFDGSNEEEMALALDFVTQKAARKIMIKTSSLAPKKKLVVEADVTKLMELSTGNMIIECF